MKFKTGMVAAAALVLASSASLADTIVWSDPVHAFTVSYPDSWRVQTEDGPHTRLRIAGPIGEDLPTCRIKVNQDGRLKIYPKDLTDEAVSQELGRDFWDGEVAEYHSVQISDFYDPAGLGSDGDATGVRISYLHDDGVESVPMYAVMFASIYGDKKYVGGCSSKAEAFERWSPVFASILNSVQLESRYHPFATGYYRDFLSDPKLSLPRSKPGTTMERTHQSFWKRLFMDKYHK
ncbi:MAG: hypothetical protein OXT65_00605 [Alphaproteobacteria bacterium]|nr:hypothetical protein [Alphaproteobacteria bacterium]